MQTVGYVDRCRGVGRVGRGRDGAGVRDPVGESHRGECQSDGCSESISAIAKDAQSAEQEADAPARKTQRPMP